MPLITEPSHRSFADITAAYLADLYATQPVMATRMGVHTYDDQLPDVGRFARQDELRRARAYLHDIDRMSVVAMSPDERLDYRLARAHVQLLISDHERIKPYERDPGLCLGIAVQGVYLVLTRSGAPVQERAAQILGRLLALPGLLRQASASVKDAPRIATESAVALASRAASYVRTEVTRFAETLAVRALRDALVAATCGASEAIEDYAAFLRDRVLPGAGGASVLGPELYEYRLRIGHFVDESVEALYEEASFAVHEVRHVLQRTAMTWFPGVEWRQVLAETDAETQWPDALLDSYRAEVDRAWRFAQTHGFIDPADEIPLHVMAAAPFYDGHEATHYEPPAPFGEMRCGALCVTEPPQWSSERLAPAGRHDAVGVCLAALRDGLPGRHLQASRAARVASRFRRHFASSSLFSDGWSLYVVPAMIEHGYTVDRKTQLAAVYEELLQWCLLRVDLGLHTQRMSVAAAIRFLVDDASVCEQDAANMVARRLMPTAPPVYGVIGRRQIQDLRCRWQRRAGARFDLARFHGELLSFGSIPPRLIRERLVAV